MSLQICPTCKKQDSVFLPYGPPIGLDGKPVGYRIQGYCNSVDCDQRYWYHPHSERVTRRNVGPIYAVWLERREYAQANLHITNAARGRLGLPPLVEEPAVPSVPPAPTERWNELFLEELKHGAPAAGQGQWLHRPQSIVQGMGNLFWDWRAWLGALWRVHGPFRKVTSDD